MKTAIIIPSRLGSTRLPKKPLHLIAGMSLIERVYRQCKMARGIDYVAVATDSDEIASHVNGFGAGAIMTPEDCRNGSERVAYAARHLAEDFDVVMNVQGDEPLIEPLVIERLASAFLDSTVTIATPISPLHSAVDQNNPNIVKVVTAANDNILYFSRATIPHQRDQVEVSTIYWKHVGLYAFRPAVLQEVRHLPATEIEEIEKLEQLRWLYHGFSIRAVRVENASIEVNTEEDVHRVEEIIRSRQ